LREASVQNLTTGRKKGSAQKDAKITMIQAEIQRLISAALPDNRSELDQRINEGARAFS